MNFPIWPDPIGYRNIDLGLDRVYKLLARLGNPHLSMPPVIHIAGTNGKGSTLSYLNAIFTEAGYKIHTYTSPHLVRFNERIILAGREIEDKYWNKLLLQCRKAAQIKPEIKVTFFEGITISAFLAFSKIKADVILLETGMGGRLDATNVVPNPLATIITSISKDHTEFLGKTLEKIAFEKAGIIKKNNLVICGKQKKSALEVIKKSAKINKSRIYIYNENWKIKKIKNKMLFEMKGKKLLFPLPALIGDHQLENAGNAIATILTQKKFKISKNNIASGLINARWKARLEKINSGKFFDLLPKNFQLFLDGGHNEGGAKTIANWLAKDKNYKNYLICAMLENKDSEKFLRHFVSNVNYLIGMEINDEPKSKSALQIKTYAENLNINSDSAKNFSEAIKKIITIHNSIKPARIVICGSLYFAGEFLREM